MSEKKNDNKRYRVSDVFELPATRLIGNDHFPEYREERNSCLWCRYDLKRKNAPRTQNPPQSQIWCSKCDVVLCCNNKRPNCFKYYHSVQE